MLKYFNIKSKITKKKEGSVNETLPSKNQILNLFNICIFISGFKNKKFTKIYNRTMHPAEMIIQSIYVDTCVT